MRAPLNPHKASTLYELMDAPTAPQVIIEPAVLAKMAYYVGLCSTEIGWFGEVTRERIDGIDTFTLTEVYLVDQQVSNVTTESASEGLAKLGMELMNHPDGRHAGIDRCNRLRLWGHSHVNMETDPSHQDDRQMKEFEESGSEYMVRLIANKKGHVRIDIFDYENRMKWYDVSWEINEPIALEIAAEIKDKVKKLAPRPIKSDKIAMHGTKLSGKFPKDDLFDGFEQSFNDDEWMPDFTPQDFNNHVDPYDKCGFMNPDWDENDKMTDYNDFYKTSSFKSSMTNARKKKRIKK